MSIILNINPCSWGKCNFCGYNSMTKFKEPTKQEYLDLLDKELLQAKKENRYIKIFNGGSWFYEEVPNWVKDITYGWLIDNNYKWLRVENRVDKVNWDEVEKLIKLGFNLTISWGIESSNNNILGENLNKGLTQEKIVEIIKISKEKAVNNLIYIMTGIPNTKSQDYFNTVDFLFFGLEYIDEIVTLICVPIKNTYFYNELWLQDKWRMLTIEEWRECKQYIKNKFQNTNIKLGFEQYHWRYIHGKIKSECYKRNKQ